MTSVATTFGLNYPSRWAVSDKVKNLSGVTVESKDLVGIEVEVENVNRVDHLENMWQSKTDGSLRNHGVEFVTRPIAACDAPAALSSLMNDSLNKTACFSPRTSVHVHLDFTKDTPAIALDVILMYCVFERLFFKFVGRQRIKSIYCVPVTETNLCRQIAERGALSPRHWEKYTSLNVRPLESFGTLEFRHMHGTFDVRKLSIWVDLITKLKTFCVVQGSKNIRSLIAQMDDSFNFHALLLDIFGNSAEFLKYQSLDDVRFTYPVAKLALCKRETKTALQQDFNTSSKFFKLRGL